MSIRAMTCCALVMSLGVTLGCSQGPKRLNAPSINASSAGAKAIEMYDTNKDGKISGDELDKCGALKSAIAQIDKGGEGFITAEKIATRVKEWQDSKLGRMSMTCLIQHNGQPLADADVKFVPEKFLGSNMIVASGKTDKNGLAVISIPTSGERTDPPGVPPGLYRVEVTKAGANIPAKYNTDTILGQEVALDAKGIREGIKFNLKY